MAFAGSQISELHSTIQSVSSLVRTVPENQPYCSRLPVRTLGQVPAFEVSCPPRSFLTAAPSLANAKTKEVKRLSNLITLRPRAAWQCGGGVEKAGTGAFSDGNRPSSRSGSYISELRATLATPPKCEAY